MITPQMHIELITKVHVPRAIRRFAALCDDEKEFQEFLGLANRVEAQPTLENLELARVALHDKAHRVARTSPMMSAAAHNGAYVCAAGYSALEIWRELKAVENHQWS